MSTTTLAAPSRPNLAGVHRRPGLGRLVGVELRKIVDTRAGFWMQIATVALTALIVVVRLTTGGADDHTFASVLEVATKPAAVVLPIAGILLVTSEWSQRTALLTFTLVPVPSRVFGAKLLASLVLTVGMLAVGVALSAAGVVLGSPPAGAWSGAGALIGQSGVYLGGGMLTGVAFGAVVLASAPAIVALFALPVAWTAVVSLPAFGRTAPWLDTRLALGPMPKEVMSVTQWAHAATALAIWMLLPLAVGIWRVTRPDAAAA
jgi:tetrahydromethanopterin S-methyltransferase subunit B